MHFTRPCPSLVVAYIGDVPNIACGVNDDDDDDDDDGTDGLNTAVS